MTFNVGDRIVFSDEEGILVRGLILYPYLYGCDVRVDGTTRPYNIYVLKLDMIHEEVFDSLLYQELLGNTI